MQHCNIKLLQTACSALKHPVVVVISLGTRDDESMRGRSRGFGRLRLRWGMREDKRLPNSERVVSEHSALPP